jgi:Ca2+-transporting ATPase
MKGESGVNWYQMKSGEVFGELGSSAKGLSAQEAQNRLKKYGPNELEEKKKKIAFMMRMDRFTDFMIIRGIFYDSSGRQFCHHRHGR